MAKCYVGTISGRGLESFVQETDNAVTFLARQAYRRRPLSSICYWVVIEEDTAARVGAVARLRCGDLCDGGDQFYLRLTEKGTKQREIPVRHDLQGCLQSYLAMSYVEDGENAAPLFCSTSGRTKRLTSRGMTAGDITRMVKRRLRDAKLPTRLSPHSFRVAVITDLLSQGVPLCDVQRLAGHVDPRTTQLYYAQTVEMCSN